MTGDMIRTRWPLNMPFNNFDSRCGEQALADSDFFRRCGLRLLCGVTPYDMISDKDIGPWCDQPEKYLLDYLVCKDDAVLLAIDITDRDPCRGIRISVPELPTAELTGEEFSQGGAAEILTQLENLLKSEEDPVWYCSLQPVPGELTQKLFDEVLLETLSNGDTVPTEYGMCIGLVRVLQGSHSSAMCSRRTADWLPDFIEMHQPVITPSSARLPFEERLARFRSGLSVSDESGVRLVREVLDTPLDEYMDGFSEELSKLRECLSDQCTTYGEAAYKIYSMIHYRDEALFEEGVTLMRTLAMPHLVDQKMMNSILYGRRVFGRDPDHMPERYQSSGENCTYQSFEGCAMHCSRKVPVSMKLTGGTQESFFRSVSILTRKNYLKWLSNALRAFLELPGRYSYGDMLRDADVCFRKDNEWEHGLGVQLFYLLLIEPYYLIYQQFEQNQKEVPKA